MTYPITLHTLMSSLIRTRSRLNALQHITMFIDSMSLCVTHLMTGFFTVSRLTLGWRPGEIISPDFNVIVCEFAELIVVHSQKLRLVGCAEMKTGDEVDNVGQQRRDDERISNASNDVGELNVELFVVVDDPTTSSRTGDGIAYTGIDAIKTEDCIVTEEGVGHQSKNTGETVFSEDIHRVIDSDPVLHFGAKIAYDSCDKTEDDASPGGDVAGCWCGSDETADCAGTETDHRPFPGETEIKEGP